MWKKWRKHKKTMAEEEIKNDKETAENKTGESQEQAPKAELTAEEKLAEVNDKYLRLYADFDNFRKRSIKERSEYLKYAGEEAWKMLLPVADDFERAIRATETATDVKAVEEGVKLVYNKLNSILKHAGVEVMDTKGKDFDAETMEAITNIPAPSPELKGKVIDEVEKGYTLNGKVIRYAKVVVGS